ncbi:type II and III secretion system protein family protein [uncultured Sphingomonas sp.]|uniref:type II and III secretion system protein family protein n=1 Tax=uncultured Sphingomonas sp. TaxID=158754 RepID=UPI0035CBC9F0
MKVANILHRALTATVAVALVAGAPADAAPGKGVRRKPATLARVAGLPVGTQRPTSEVVLSVGEGELITLPANVADVWVSDPAVADVYVSNPRQIHLFGKSFGTVTLFATSASGTVVYATNVRVGDNVNSVQRMLKLAMPENDIRVVTFGRIAVLTGTVAAPADIAQAEQLATAILNPGIDASQAGAALKIAVISRLKTATPLQVNLQVKIAEVSRSFIKNIGVNLTTRDTTGGFLFGVASGRSPGTIGSIDTSTLPQLDASSRFGLPAGSVSLPFDPKIGDFVYPNSGTKFDFSSLAGATRTTLGLAGKLFGLDILSALDLGETDGQVTTLAEPNVSALSGETASFLAGGEIPIPISQGLGAVSVEYKQYGVSLAYTPTVLADGRISLRVRPEVSQLSASGAVVLNGVQIPALTTRRTETTVEMGSGQSMMIAGLLSNSTDNQIDKAPGLGDVPILGSLFRSNGWKRQETELVIVITPYLVKPVNAGDIALPTDGYKAPTDLGRVLGGQLGGGTTGGERPKPSMAAPVTAAPALGLAAPVPAGPDAPSLPAPDVRRDERKALPPTSKKKGSAPAAAPGFSNN